MNQPTTLHRGSSARLVALLLLLVLTVVSSLLLSRAPAPKARELPQWNQLYREAGDKWVSLASFWRASDASAFWSDNALEAALGQYRLAQLTGPSDLRTTLSYGLALQAMHRTNEAQATLRNALKQQRDVEAREQLLAVLEGLFGHQVGPARLQALWAQTKDLAPAPFVFAEAFTQVGRDDLAQQANDLALARARTVEPTFVAVLVVCCLLLLAGLIGLVLFALFRITPARAIGEVTAPSADWTGRDALEGLLVFVLLQLPLGALSQWPTLSPNARAFALVGAALVSGLGAVAWIKLFAGRRTSLGWRLSRPVRSALVGLATGGALIVPALALDRLLESVLHLSPQQHPLIPAFAAAMGLPARLFIVVGACALIPVLEETLFRGLLYGALRRYLPVWVAMLVSAAIFAAGHVAGAGFLSLLLAGFVWAWLYERTGSLLAPAVAHGAFNAFSVALLMFYFR